MAAVSVLVKRLDALSALLLHPRCRLVKLSLSSEKKASWWQCVVVCTTGLARAEASRAVMCVHQAAKLVTRARRRLHRRWRGTARCSIWMSAVSVAVMLEFCA
jgi:hypothetical protein